MRAKSRAGLDLLGAEGTSGNLTPPPTPLKLRILPPQVSQSIGIAAFTGQANYKFRSPRSGDLNMRSARPMTASPSAAPVKRRRHSYPRSQEAVSLAAHDMKTPLSVLNGYVELLLSERLGNL